MGRVRTKTVKKAARNLLESYYQKLTSDFHVNKKILSEVAIVPTKKLRNKIAGYATHLMNRIKKGPVKGISLKVQQEERERRLDWVPKESQIKLNQIKIDPQTAEMIKKRFGETFHNQIAKNLDVVQTEKKDRRRRQQKGGRDGKPRRERKDDRRQGGHRDGDRDREDGKRRQAAEKRQERAERKEGRNEPVEKQDDESKPGAKRQTRRRGREGKD